MNQLESCNPWPVIFRTKYDFDFENKLKGKVIDSLKASDQFIKSMNVPEKWRCYCCCFVSRSKIF